MQFYKELAAHICSRINKFTKVTSSPKRVVDIRKPIGNLNPGRYFWYSRRVYINSCFSGRITPNIWGYAPAFREVSVTKRGQIIDFKSFINWIESMTPDDLRTRLPLYGKALEKAYSVGYLEDFPRIDGDDALIRLFSFLVTGTVSLENGGEIIFARQRMIMDVSPFQALIIKAIRQLSLYWYKEETEFSKEDELAAARRFLETDRTVINATQLRENLLNHEVRWLRRIIKWLLPKFPQLSSTKRIYRRSGSVLVPVDIPVYEEKFFNHSVGASADLQSATRFNQRRWSRPASDELWPLILAGTYDNLYATTLPTSDVEEKTSKLVIVPKDSRGPRVICEEPASMAYAQQYVKERLYDHLSARFLSLEYQDGNQYGAFKGSLDGSLATLDLKDASDRVSVEHINYLFPSDWKDMLLKLRTPYCNVCGVVIQLVKYAPMGSALTFPIETILYSAATIYVHMLHVGVKETYLALKNGSTCRTYGDDIIVPSEMAEDLVDLLQRLGFVINKDKSFTRGRYRESCGKHYINGYDVTICQKRKKELMPDFITNASALWPGFRANYVCGVAEGVVSGPLAFSNGKFRWNAALHRVEVFVSTNIAKPYETEVKLYQSDAVLPGDVITYHDAVDLRAYTDWLKNYSGYEAYYGPADNKNYKSIAEFIDENPATRKPRRIQLFTMQEKTHRKWVPYGYKYSAEQKEFLDFALQLKNENEAAQKAREQARAKAKAEAEAKLNKDAEAVSSKQTEAKPSTSNKTELGSSARRKPLANKQGANKAKDKNSKPAANTEKISLPVIKTINKNTPSAKAD